MMNIKDFFDRCPFCGGSKSSVMEDEYAGQDGYRVKCDTDGCWAETGHFDTPEAARAAWNKRFAISVKVVNQLTKDDFAEAVFQGTVMAKYTSPWIDELPTNEGTYWIKFGDLDNTKVVSVYVEDDGELAVDHNGRPNYISVRKFVEMFHVHGWSEILPPPTDYQIT